MKCYITIFEQFTFPAQMLPDIRRLGLKPVLIDNDSTYPPCLDWLASVNCEVIRNPENDGARAFWRGQALYLKQKEPFVVTDPDLDLSGVPDDAVNVMLSILKDNPKFVKVGLSLEIDDLPDHYAFAKQARDSQKRFWQNPIPGGFKSEIDTTFALYLPGKSFDYQAIRLDRPYTARHLPWYLDLSNPSDELKYYLARVNHTPTYTNQHKQFVEQNA